MLGERLEEGLGRVFNVIIMDGSCTVIGGLHHFARREPGRSVVRRRLIVDLEATPWSATTTY